MMLLKQNVRAFERDIAESKGYRYTTHAAFSSRISNERMTKATIQKIPTTAQKVLDVGCGDGTYSYHLYAALPQLDITGFDPASEAIGIAQQRYPHLHFYTGNVLDRMSIPQGSFDVAIVRGVLHHLSEPLRALENLRHIAQTLLILEPNGNNPILKVIEKVSHYHREHEEQSFSNRLLERWCQEAGWKVMSVDFIGFVPFFFPEMPSRIIYHVQPYLERVPIVRNYLSAQIVLFCEHQ